MGCYEGAGWLGLKSWGTSDALSGLVEQQKDAASRVLERGSWPHTSPPSPPRARGEDAVAGRQTLPSPLVSPAACRAREPALHQLCRAQLPAHTLNFQWFDHSGHSFGQGTLLIA